MMAGSMVGWKAMLMADRTAEPWGVLTAELLAVMMADRLVAAKVSSLAGCWESLMVELMVVGTAQLKVDCLVERKGLTRADLTAESKVWKKVDPKAQQKVVRWGLKTVGWTVEQKG